MYTYKDTLKVFGEIPELLNSLSGLEYELGVVTSKTREEFKNDFCRFEIRCCFKQIICADDTIRHKPFPGPLFQYMEVTGADRSRTLYIGDSAYDSKCAERAGADFALAVWGSHSQTVKADYRLEKPKELLSVIAGQ